MEDSSERGGHITVVKKEAFAGKGGVMALQYRVSSSMALGGLNPWQGAAAASSRTSTRSSQAMLRGSILIVAAVLPLAEAFAPAARDPLRLARPRSAAASSIPLISMNDSGEGAGFSMPFFGKRQAGEKEVAAAEEEKMTIEKVASFGIAGVLSIAVAETVFWVLSFPTSELLYYSSTGEWIDLLTQEGQIKFLAFTVRSAPCTSTPACHRATPLHANTHALRLCQLDAGGLGCTRRCHCAVSHRAHRRGDDALDGQGRGAAIHKAGARQDEEQGCVRARVHPAACEERFAW